MADPNDKLGAVAPGADNAQRQEVRRSVLRKVTGRGVPTFIEQVRAPNGTPCLLIVERMARGPEISDKEADAFVSEARAAASLQHANVLRGRAVTIRKDEIIVASDFVEGERLSDLWRALAASGKTMPPDIAARILIDVLAGLQALHEYADPKGPRQKLIHGEMTAANVLVGTDGVSRILHASRIRRPGALPTDAGSIAPEVVSKAAADRRADVFGVGVLLWQALSGVASLGEASSADRVARIRAGRVEKAAAPKDAPWAAALPDIAARAMSPGQGDRFATAAAMSAELRKAIGANLPDAARVTSFVTTHAGTKIDAPIAKAPEAAAPKAPPTPVAQAVVPAAAKPASATATPTIAKAPAPTAVKPPVPSAAKPPEAPIAKPAPAPAARPPVMPAAKAPAAPAAKPLVSPAATPAAALAAKPPAPIAAKPAAPSTTKLPSNTLPLPVFDDAASPPPAPAPALKPVAMPAAKAPATAPKPVGPVAAPAPVAKPIAPMPVIPGPAPAPTPFGKPLPKPTPIEPKATTGARAAKPPPLAPKSPEPQKPTTQAGPSNSPKAIYFPAHIPTLPPPPMDDDDHVVDIDGSEAQSVPPSDPPDGPPMFPRIPIASAAGLTPPVSERPVPHEPKVVIASRPDDGMDIDLASEPPPSSEDMTRRVAPFPGILAQLDPDFATGKRTDTPAAKPVMAPAPARTDEFVGGSSTRSEALADPIPKRSTRRARTIAAVIGGACVLIAGIAAVRLWQQKSSVAPPSAATPTPDPAVPALRSPAPSPMPVEIPKTKADPTPPAPKPTGIAPAPTPPPPAPEPSMPPAASDPSSAQPSDTPADDENGERAKPSGATPPAWAPHAPRSPGAEPPTPPPRPKFDPKRI